jgi:hypothetical protein
VRPRLLKRKTFLKQKKDFFFHLKETNLDNILKVEISFFKRGEKSKILKNEENNKFAISQGKISRNYI